MAWKEVSKGNVIDVKKEEGRPHEGVYKGKKDIETKIGKQVIWQFVDEDGIVRGGWAKWTGQIRYVAASAMMTVERSTGTASRIQKPYMAYWSSPGDLWIPSVTTTDDGTTYTAAWTSKVHQSDVPTQRMSVQRAAVLSFNLQTAVQITLFGNFGESSKSCTASPSSLRRYTAFDDAALQDAYAVQVSFTESGTPSSVIYQFEALHLEVDPNEVL